MWRFSCALRGGVKLSIGMPLRRCAMASKWRIESGKTGHLRAMLGDPAFEYIVQKNEKLDSRTSCENDIKDPIQNYISINFSFPLQGGERSCTRGACYKCGEGANPISESLGGALCCQ